MRRYWKWFFCLFVLSGFLGSCIRSPRTAREPLAGMESTLEVLPEAARSLKGVSLPACVQNLHDFEIAYVIRVIDGDSIEVKVNGREEQVRYIGINTPEYYSDERDEAEEATRLNRGLVEGRYVLLIRDISERDKFDRLLRYVFTEDEFVNYELVKTGAAEAKEYPPDTACHVVFRQAE